MGSPHNIVVTFTGRSASVLHQTAERKGISHADVLGEALAVYAVCTENQRRGNKIVAVSPDGDAHEMVLTFSPDLN